MDRTLYRRPLSSDAIAFSSPEGRQVFAEALATNGLDGYFPLAEQFHTQSDPSYCGLGSLVVALNALAIDPGRLWKGPWRWFAEDLLDCCVPLEEVRTRGLDLDELACLARCNGADVEVHRADSTEVVTWRTDVARASRGETVLVASYDRAALGQTGSGHFSPIGGYHAGRDLALVLDVARFKYPPHWVPMPRLWEAMRPVDPTTGRARGWMNLRPRTRGISLGFSLKCNGDNWRGIASRLACVVAELGTTADIAQVARAVVPLLANLELRTPGAAAHEDALTTARTALRDVPVYAHVARVVGEQSAEGVTLLLLAMVDLLAPAQRSELTALSATLSPDTPLGSELANLRAQFGAVWSHARAAESAGCQAC